MPSGPCFLSCLACLLRSTLPLRCALRIEISRLGVVRVLSTPDRATSAWLSHARSTCLYLRCRLRLPLRISRHHGTVQTERWRKVMLGSLGTTDNVGVVVVDLRHIWERDPEPPPPVVNGCGCVASWDLQGFVGVRAEGAVAQTLLIFKLKRIKDFVVSVRCGWEDGGD